MKGLKLLVSLKTIFMENIEHGDFNDALVLDENGLLVERNPEYEGRNGIVVLNENGIVIKRGTR